MTPFEAVYGRPPPSLLSYVTDTARVQNVEEELISRDRTLTILKDNLTRADRKRMERHFAMGDHVLLKLQPYRQASVRGALPQKLEPRYFGPYPIVSKIGSVAYKLLLPIEAKIHDVFHVSQLKSYRGDPNRAIRDYPKWWEFPEKQPAEVLGRWITKKGNQAATEVLIKWKEEEEEAATWENLEELHQKYPHFDLGTRSFLRGMECEGSIRPLL